MINCPQTTPDPLGHELTIASDGKTQPGDEKIVTCEKCSFSVWGIVTEIKPDGQIRVSYTHPTDPCKKNDDSKSNIDNKELVTC